ncbi:hypothetical protein GOP47_0012931 [Adiantum capillus-veneris]|uniref:Uncharacterized protein n=1 Tax=Adiantum capillus-veneris TaxID=13818 RepID=A0A9D4URM0_ADICA|nr:hypothetical protein GOP47_0012931 [Adiantum capillus-veneris]
MQHVSLEGAKYNDLLKRRRQISEWLARSKGRELRRRGLGAGRTYQAKSRIMGKKEVLMGLHESAAHNGQVQAWQTDLKAFDTLKADHEDELRRVRSEAYQVATMYAMFQGVIFTAISQQTLLTCSLSWSPASISIAAFVATFLVIADKLKSMGEVNQDIAAIGSSMSALLDCLDRVDEEGSELDLDTVLPQVKYQRFKCLFILSRDGLCALLFLAVFSFFVSYFSISSLCKDCSRCD